MKKVAQLMNGVEVFENGLEADFEEAQRILDVNPYTEVIDAEYAYTARPANDFEATYAMKVVRQEEYDRFVHRLLLEKGCADFREEKRAKRAQLNTWYYRGYVTGEDWDVLYDNINKMKCPCQKCQMRVPTFEEWKTNKFDNGKQVMKLSKKLNKTGFSKELLDLYTLQPKHEKRVFFTVTSEPQFIAGMSYYSDMEWDGMGGSSCQDPKHEDDDYCIKLGGALHDNKLFVGFLHDSLEDLDDMEAKMRARTLFRYVHIDDKPALIATYYYGNNDTKAMLGSVLKGLQQVDIYDKDIRRGYDTETIKEPANGAFDMVVMDDVHVYETREEYVDVNCPLCDGSGEYEVWSDKCDKYIEVCCPSCGGDGTIETCVFVEVDEWIEVESRTPVKPYVEGYDHCGNWVLVAVDVDKVREYREDFEGVVLSQMSMEV